MSFHSRAFTCEFASYSPPLPSLTLNVKPVYFSDHVQRNRDKGLAEREQRLAQMLSSVHGRLAEGASFESLRTELRELLFLQREIFNFRYVAADGSRAHNVDFDFAELRALELMLQGFERAAMPVFSGLTHELMAITTRRKHVVVDERLSNVHVLEAWNPYSGVYSHSEILIVDVATGDVRPAVINKTMNAAMGDLRAQVVGAGDFSQKMSCFSCHSQHVKADWNIEEHFPDKHLIRELAR